MSVVIMRELARYKCGHFDEIKGLTRAELDYLAALATKYDCISCEVGLMLSEIRRTTGTESGDRG